MKKIYSVRSFNYFFLLIAMASLISCEKKGEDDKGVLLDDNLLRSASAYTRVLNSRETGENAAFAIKEVKREGSSLAIRVLGGCSEDSYKVIWNGMIAESYPAQIYLVLTHEPPGDICQSSSEYLLSVDLRKIVGEAAASGDFVFHVANGSVKQNKSLYPDGTVSTEE